MSPKPFSLSVKLMIRNKEGKYLLLKRSAASKANAGKWEMPGGKVEPHEGFAEALLREVYEETGLTAVLEHVAGTAELELPDRIVVYMIMEGAIEAGSVTLSSEHDGYAWVYPAELESYDWVKQFRPFMERFYTV